MSQQATNGKDITSNVRVQQQQHRQEQERQRHQLHLQFLQRHQQSQNASKRARDCSDDDDNDAAAPPAAKRPAKAPPTDLPIRAYLATIYPARASKYLNDDSRKLHDGYIRTPDDLAAIYRQTQGTFIHDLKQEYGIKLGLAAYIFQDVRSRIEPKEQPLSSLSDTPTNPDWPDMVTSHSHEPMGLCLWALNADYESKLAPTANHADVVGFAKELLKDSPTKSLYYCKDLWKSFGSATVQAIRSLGAATIYVDASIPSDD